VWVFFTDWYSFVSLLDIIWECSEQESEMPRKSKEKVKEEAEQTAYCRMEFLKRNRKFQKDLEKLCEEYV